jgi:hypothetical protein
MSAKKNRRCAVISIIPDGEDIDVLSLQEAIVAHHDITDEPFCIQWHDFKLRYTSVPLPNLTSIHSLTIMPSIPGRLGSMTESQMVVRDC